VRTPVDRYLPPDHQAFVAAEPPTGRVIVIAPTRAACETIEIAIGLRLETYLEQHHGARVRELARSGRGFGIVAGTGTGKTLAIRPIAEEIVGRDGQVPLNVGVVNREREATPELPSQNVIVVTTGIARRWFQDGDILPHDTLVVDEIHQTSAELELCLALGKRVGCRFIWLSATVDPRFYARYLDSADVLEVYSFDPKRAAKVVVEDRTPVGFLDDRFLQSVQKGRRGVGVFLPTRAGVEETAASVAMRYPRIHAAYYHGGEPIRVIRPFLEGDGQQPYVLAMTAAGQSALNVRGLDTVVIDDTRFTNVVERGRNVLTRTHLGSNEILQMAGRVHGRVEGGRVFILSDRDIDFATLRPTEPEFQLAGDSERVALTCAALGVRADELELPVPLDRASYRRAMDKLRDRHIVDDTGRLSPYGRAVEALPVDRAWAELLVNADDELLPFLAVSSAVESLHRMTREDRDLDGLVVRGSDHLTAYNVYAEAYREAGYVGEVYGLPRHLFDAEKMERWAERRGVLVKSVEDAALAMASVYRSLGVPLPDRLPWAGERAYRAFADLLARYMPFDLVLDGETAWGEEARVSKTSVCGSWGAVAGTLRFFADRFGIPRASIEGTQLAPDLLRRHARLGPPELAYDGRRKALVRTRRAEYFGFELERETEAVAEWDDAMADDAERVLALALARGEARHVAVRRNQHAVDTAREVWRRSGGLTPRLGERELAELYREQLHGVRSLEELRARPLRVDLDALVPPAERERYLALPSVADVRGRDVEIQYDVEEAEDGAPVGVARLRLPEKLARTLVEEELPVLDRPVRFVVMRGPRGALRARTLDELQELLDLPWAPGEDEAAGDGGRGDASGREHRRREREERTTANAMRRHATERGAGRGFAGGRDGSRDGTRDGGGGSGRGPGGPPARGPKRGPGGPPARGPGGRRRGR
jgi:hypothetical protein